MFLAGEGRVYIASAGFANFGWVSNSIAPVDKLQILCMLHDNESETLAAIGGRRLEVAYSLSSVFARPPVKHAPAITHPFGRRWAPRRPLPGVSIAIVYTISCGRRVIRPPSIATRFHPGGATSVGRLVRRGRRAGCGPVTRSVSRPRCSLECAVCWPIARAPVCVMCCFRLRIGAGHLANSRLGADQHLLGHNRAGRAAPAVCCGSILHGLSAGGSSSDDNAPCIFVRGTASLQLSPRLAALQPSRMVPPGVWARYGT